MDKYLKIFIKNIERFAPDWSSYKLAKEAGVSQATLSSIYSGRSNPSLETIVKLANCFQVKPGDLLNDQSESTIPPDLKLLMENQSEAFYETVRNLALMMKNSDSKKRVK
jgi:transcriptional regulator with XRE-family HTH domain